MAKRKNLTKKEVVQNIKAVQEADRKRKLIRETVYPFLLELNDTIGFTKVFLQAASAAVEGAFSEKQREVKIADLLPRLTEVFTGNKSSAETEKYIRFFELMKNETVFDFTTMIQYMPRVIEQYFTKETDKSPVLNIPIDKILG